MTDLRELLQECHAEILFWLPHRDSPPNRSRLLLERIDATLAHLPTVPTRNAQEEVDGGYFAEGQAEQQGPQPAAPPTYAGPIWAPPEDWLKDHEIPALGSALQKLGSHLANMLLEDDWNNIEQMLFAVARESAAPQPPAGKSEDKVPPPKWYDLLLAIRKQWMTADGYFKTMWAGPIREGIDAILENWPAADAIPREIHERLVRDAKQEALREAAAWFNSKWIGPPPIQADIALWLNRMASEHERTS